MDDIVTQKYTSVPGRPRPGDFARSGEAIIDNDIVVSDRIQELRA